MKKTKSVNNLMINNSNFEKDGKFKNIMNSPNFGKQQIILQSCCFFDYEKCQTPKAQSPGINFSNSTKNRINSSRIAEKNKNTFSTNKSNMDLVKSKFDEMRKNEVNKLKNENKVLKDTINNLILQLDKTFRIAENVKNKEKNISQINTYKENEIINMKNKINTLIVEKQQLLNKIKNKEGNLYNRKKSWSNLQSPKFGHKKNISFSDYEFNNIKDKNICITENNKNETERINKYYTDWNKSFCKEKTNNEKVKNNQNKGIKVLYDKRLNKRTYIFNKKKTENSKKEYPLMKSRNQLDRQNLNYNSLREKYENLLKEKNELKINFHGLLNECDNSRIKHNTEELCINNDNSFIKSNINSTQFTNDSIYFKSKISNLEKNNYELKQKLIEIENKEKIKYDSLMNKYNKLYSELTLLKTEHNKQIKNKEEIIQEINNKYNNIMKEYNNKSSVFNNLKAKYDQLTRINNNNINTMNSNRVKLNEIIMENSEMKNELRKKIDEITQKNIEIGRFKKIVNDLNELKNMENKLKQNQISNNNMGNSDENENINMNDKMLLNEMEEYKLQINKLNKEKEELQKECEYLKGNNDKNNLKSSLEVYENKLKELEDEKNKEIKLNQNLKEKNKKLEKALNKANQELDQYEIESKEADIEIKSFKMKINELLEEIKKLKYKETIEEVIEENYENEDDKKENN